MARFRRSSRAFPAAFLVAGVLMAAGLLPSFGCGSRPECFPVTGIVTYRGQPVEGAGVTFMPKDGRPAAGVTDSQGRFTLTNVKPGDGAIPGEHVVCIAKSIPDPQDKTDSPYRKMISALPARYATPVQSPLKAAVADGASNDFRFDLTD